MYRLLMILAAILNTLPRLVDFGTGVFMMGQKYSPTGKWWYYAGQAASYVLILCATKYPKKQETFDIVLWLAVSNLVDEMFFNPTIIGINEIAFAITIICYYIYKHRRKEYEVK